MVEYVNSDSKDNDISIYRIITIERLIELFKTNINVLASPHLWEDPFENFLSKIQVKVDNRTVLMNKGLWGQCWTTRAKETDAMWRIYTPSKNGVKIKANARRVVESIVNSKTYKYLLKEADNVNRSKEEYEPEVSVKLYCGPVNYLTVSKLTDSIFLRQIFDRDYTHSLFIKRLEFEHEKEFRFVLEYYNHKLMDLDLGFLFKHEFDFADIVEEVVFDPRMDIKMFEVYKNYLTNQGFIGTIKQSMLYKLPKKNFYL